MAIGPTGNAVIEARGVHRRFSGEQVLAGVDLSIARDSKTVLQGRSGSGKTTLLRILAGLDAPDDGSVFFDGALAGARQVLLQPHLRRIGFVFQSAALWPHMTVEANVAFALTGLGRSDRRTRLAQVFEATGIGTLCSKYPNQLSSGQARRVAVARALAARPHYLFLDESFVNLDPSSRAELLQVVLAEAAQHGMGLLCVTHDAAEQQRIGGRLVQLRHGRIVGGDGT